jgi:hypothetical protein
MPMINTLLTASISFLSDPWLTVASEEQRLPMHAATMHLVDKGICWVRERLNPNL